MIHRLIEFALKARSWVIVFFLGIVGIGAFSVSRLPIDAVPDITNVQVMINTKTGALAPGEIETIVTYPIEMELSGLPNVDEIRSISKYGLSQITVVFKDGMDLYFARQLIAERLVAIQGSLPDGFVPQMGPVSTGLGEVLMYSVTAKEGSKLAGLPDEDRLRYLHTIQEWNIKPHMKTVTGVAEIDTNGGYTRAVYIALDPIKMERYGVSMRRIIESLDQIGVNHGGGYIERSGKRIIVRSLSRLESVDRIKEIPIRLYALQAPIKLGDIAYIGEGNMPRVGATTSNGAESVTGTVLMRIGANSRTVAEESIQKLESLPIPADVKVNILYSRSYLVDATIHTVEKNLAEGAALVIVILLLILGNFRAAIIVSLAIPVSMLFSASAMLYFGISANLMSLGAVDFGLLVDASVVMIENIIRKFEHSNKTNLTRKDKFQMVLEAAKEVSGPVVSGLVIIMIVYVPILTLTGIEGKMFRPMAATVLLALGASLLVALILMPLLAYIFIKIPKNESVSFFFRLIDKVYRPVLDFSLRMPVSLSIAALSIALLSVFLFTRLGSDFIPSLDEGDLVIGMVRSPDISLEESVNQQQKAEDIIAQFPEVEQVFSRIGTPESATDPMGINFADTFVILKKDHSQWPERIDGRHYTKEELYRAIADVIEKELPGHSLSPTMPIEMRFNEMLEGSRADITLRIFGNDLDKLMQLVAIAENKLQAIDGVDEVAMDELTALRRTPVVDIKPDYARLSSRGIDMGQLNEAFSTGMAGKEIGSFYEGDRRIPILLRLDDKYRNKSGYMDRIPIDLPGGGTLSLGELARIENGQQVTTIARYNSQRYAAVSIYLKDRDVASFATEAQKLMNDSLDLPEGFYLTWGGQFKNLQKAKIRLMIIVPITLAIIFMILLRTFNDLAHTLLIFNTIPFAVTGGIIALYLRDISFSISAAVGFIALTGIAILNAMVLVSFFNERMDGIRTIREVVFFGTLMRLRPVLMTALVASLGFIPMALNTGTGSEVQRPLATVVIGGLVSSTLLTLLLLPALYLKLEEWRRGITKVIEEHIEEI